MKIGFTSFAFLLLSCICVSCTRDISLDAGERVVVVECILSCDSVQTLKLFYSHAKDSQLDISEEKAMVVKNADVELFDETENRSVGKFQFSGKDWQLEYSAVPEHSYSLEINIEGYGKVSAKQTMPKQINVVGGLHSGAPWVNEAGFDQYGIEFYGTAFYCYSLPANTWIYALAYDEKTGETHIADEICTDYPHIDNLFLTGETYDPYRVELQIKDEGIYPLTICKYLKGFPLYRRFLHTKAELAGTEDRPRAAFIVSGSFYYYDNPRKDRPLGEKGGIVFTTVSADYDRYLQEAIHYQQQQEESDDLTTIYIRDNIFSNIKGGVGIFGAKTEYKSEWIMTVINKEVL